MFLKRGIAVLKPEFAALRRLRPPSSSAADYSTSMAAFSQKLGALGNAVRALTAGQDPTTVVKLLQRQLAPIETRENAAWAALQIPSCANR